MSVRRYDTIALGLLKKEEELEEEKEELEEEEEEELEEEEECQITIFNFAQCSGGSRGGPMEPGPPPPRPGWPGRGPIS